MEITELLVHRESGAATSAEALTTDVPGLVIIPNGRQCVAGWVNVTHVDSGLSLADFGTLRDAAAFVAELAGWCDWTQSNSEVLKELGIDLDCVGVVISKHKGRRNDDERME